MSFAITGMGIAVPSTRVTQPEALAVARGLNRGQLDDATWLDGIYANSGVQIRHQSLGMSLIQEFSGSDGSPSASVFAPRGASWQPPSTATRMQLYAEQAPRLAVAAARDALAEANILPASITHIVLVTCTGFAAPGVDWALVDELGLSPTVERTLVGFMGCHGAINGLRVCSAFAADPKAVILMVCVELSSLHYYYGTEPDKVIANALFADGAAAVVGRNGTGPWTVAATGSCRIPDSAFAMRWDIGDQGFTMTLSRQIPRLIAKHVPAWLEQWLAPHGHTPQSLAAWAIHPGGPRILDAVQESLAIQPEQAAVSRAIFAEYGNMSSPTVLFVLQRLRLQHAPRPIGLIAFGPGLVAEAALIQ
ncbi:MAG: type III polyketide synthase [Gemmataceae bacterium]